MPRGRIAIESEPSGSSTTTGFFFTLVIDKMPTWGWLMIDCIRSMPYGPVMSSGVSFFVRARLARSAMSRAIERMRLPSASRTTGTIRPLKSRSTATPRATEWCTTSELSATEAFTFGYVRIESITARAMNGMYVSEKPSSALKPSFFADRTRSTPL